MENHGYIKEAVMFALITGHEKLFTTAMELLSTLPQVTHLTNFKICHNLITLTLPHLRFINSFITMK